MFHGSAGAHRPRPFERQKRMYAVGSYAPTRYRHRIIRQVHDLAAEFGIDPSRRTAARGIPSPERPAGPVPAGPARPGLL